MRHYGIAILPRLMSAAAYNIPMIVPGNERSPCITPNATGENATDT
jgi:hypothetical protein